MKAQFIVTIEGDWMHELGQNDKRITKRKAEQMLRTAVNGCFEFLADKVKVEAVKDVVMENSK